MIEKKGFIAEGTTCTSCEKIIQRQAKKIEGVTSIKFDYTTQSGHVSFDNEKTNLDEILYSIEEKGYKCFILDETPSAKTANNSLGWMFGIAGVLIVGYFIFNFVETINLPKISQNMGYGLLFVVGLLTGFHCIAMCGGLVVSYTAKDAKEGRSSHRSHIMYGAGKLVSYTVIGAIFGLLGSIVAFTPVMRGVAGILAGLFLIIFGLNMLNLIPALRKIRIKLPKNLSKKINKITNKNSSPLIIGLLNGLMIACGPLQAIYIMAAGTGSPIEGAKLLFVFALGTLPVMLGFGYFASLVSSKLTHKLLKASGAIVILLGLFMINNGLIVTGSGYDMGSLITSVSEGGSATENQAKNIAVVDGFQEISMEVTRSGWEPDTFVLKKDVPVKWKINGKELTGCNNAIQVPEYNLEFDIKEGEQIIEFTPTKEGVVSWSCWMGMIPGTFIVQEDVTDTESIEKQINSIPKTPGVCDGGSCGGSCGGGCGGGCGA